MLQKLNVPSNNNGEIEEVKTNESDKNRDGERAEAKQSANSPGASGILNQSNSQQVATTANDAETNTADRQEQDKVVQLPKGISVRVPEQAMTKLKMALSSQPNGEGRDDDPLNAYEKLLRPDGPYVLFG